MLDHPLQMLYGMISKHLRGQNISAIAAIWKGQKINTRCLYKFNWNFKKEIHGSDPNMKNFDLFMAAQRDLHLHITRLDLYKKKNFEQGGRNGRFLAMLVQHDYPATLLSEVRTSGGENGYFLQITWFLFKKSTCLQDIDIVITINKQNKLKRITYTGELVKFYCHYTRTI